MQLSRLLQILREFSSEPILSDYVIDAVWQEMNAIKVVTRSYPFSVITSYICMHYSRLGGLLE